MVTLNTPPIFVDASAYPLQDIKLATPACKTDGTAAFTEPSHKPVVLVVEDNPDNRAAVKSLLQETCTVLEANGGLAGYELAMMVRPDLILLDIAMPVMDGFKTLTAIRNVERVHQTPIIAMTGPKMIASREDFLANGFDDYISRPINPEQLEATIQGVIHKYR